MICLINSKPKCYLIGLIFSSTILISRFQKEVREKRGKRWFYCIRRLTFGGNDLFNCQLYVLKIILNLPKKCLKDLITTHLKCHRKNKLIQKTKYHFQMCNYFHYNCLVYCVV